MKKLIPLLLFVQFIMTSATIEAQIKIHDNGHISLGSLSTVYGLQIQPNGYSHFQTTNNNAYSWATLSMVNQNTQKHWIVGNNSGYHHLFYVLGNGNTWSNGYYVIQPQSLRGDIEGMNIGGTRALEILSGLKGYYYSGDDPLSAESLEGNEFVSEEAVEGILNDNGKRKAGLSAEELEAVFPESVRTDPEARLGIDYASIIAVLVEAINEQQAEIECLRRVLEKNGSLER